MSLIKNLCKESEKKEYKSKSDNVDDGDQKQRPIIKSAIDLQRLKLEKLMKNPDKPAVIPEPRKDKDYMQSVPSFVRNVMGSSAGAGSGEFHVYRHLRRKEYARQKMIQNKSEKELLDDAYQHKLEENRRMAEEKTAKKRAKRLKKKQRTKMTKRSKPSNEALKSSEDECSSDDDKEDHSDADVPTKTVKETELKNLDESTETKNVGQTTEIKNVEEATEIKDLEAATEIPEKAKLDECAE